MSTDLPEENGDGEAESWVEIPIEDELKNSYLTYAMSVIVSRALPDVRDGLKPSQRRILVAMNDLNLSPGASRVKCAKISGDTSGNYHPHGEAIVYPTLVRMAQEWNMRHTLVDKQGNFGSIAGLPPAAMRYTEARMSAVAGLMLDDLKLDTVDYVPTYDERRLEPTVLPSKFPNLLVNGSSGIAVSMATSLPPHNLGEVCDALEMVIDSPECSIQEIMTVLPGPDFPTGGMICGRSGIQRQILRCWQYYFVWVPTLLSFLLFIILGIADWNSLNWPALIRWSFGVMLIAVGNLLAWGGVWQFGLKKTSGAEGSLVTSRLYRHSRNPQYVGDICTLVGWMILSASVWAIPAILAGILAFVLAPFAEESWLEKIHGDEYREYRKSTPRFVFV